MYQLSSFQYMDRLSDKDICVFGIYGQMEKRWVLGSPFLNDYYQVYDMTRNQIGLVPTVYVNPSPGQIGSPNAVNQDELYAKIFVLAVGVSLYIFSQVVRSMLTTDKEPERPAPAPKPKAPENMMMADDKEKLMDGDMGM